MKRSPLPQRLLVVLDRATALPLSLRQLASQLHLGGSRWWHLRDAGVSKQEWGQLVDEARQRSAGWRAVFNGGGAWAHQIGIGAHLKAATTEPPSTGWNLLGRSAHDEDEVLTGVRHGVDYLVVGPVYPTTSKPDAEPLGLERFARLVEVAGAIPVLAIGGVTPDRVAELIGAGAYGVSVRSGIVAQDDSEAATARYLEALAAVSELPTDHT